MLISELIASYRSDPVSTYTSLRYQTRIHYDSLLKRVEADIGAQPVGAIRTRDFQLTYQTWQLRGIAMSHALVGMLRTICNYGQVYLEDDDCMRLANKLSAMRFKMGKPRQVHLTAEMAVAIRNKAREWGLYSIAQAQAFQFECTLRQRDVIGEWIPTTEPGDSDTLDGSFKWLRGIRWEEIDDNLILRHVTSKRQKEVEINLTLAPMVMAELRFDYLIVEPFKRDRLPAKGPVIVSEATALPFNAWEYRRLWRGLARHCGIPDSVFSMDTRSGAITEAFAAGVSTDTARKMATHTETATTNRYSRGEAEAIAEGMAKRAAYRSAG
jgi:hypothetical protein